LRWLAFGAAGALLGGITFFYLPTLDVPFALIYVASGALAAALEVGLARRAASAPVASVQGVTARALSAFALVAGVASATFALLYASLVAP